MAIAVDVTSIVPVKSPALLLAVARIVHFSVVIVPLYLSYPSRSSVRPGDSDSVVVPLDGGNGDRPCP